ncbi:MAG: hypothetical protein MUO95_08680, partial [Methanoregula sp.]|nr:hypothetical protein [Methanoregula sp.]
CTKSGQSVKENYPGARLTLHAAGANPRNVARAVVDGVCRSCCEVRMHDAVIVTLYPYVTMNAAAPDGAPLRRIGD